ncbi:MAG: hypothetical protein ACJ792_00020 [Gemmatimonadaceae bacterium]
MRPRSTQYAFLCCLLICGACASGGRQGQTVSPEQARCAAVSDSISKYVSTDALPFAHLVGNPRRLPSTATIRPGDSVVVEFAVRPDGTGDTAVVQLMGATDPQFVKSAMLFATENHFIPAQVAGCNVVSRYQLVARRAAGTR